MKIIQTNMFFKLFYNKQVRIFNPKDKASLVGLKNYVETAFKSLPEKFSFYYLDEENDEITLSTENDFKIMMETSNKIIKIHIKQTDEDFFDQTVSVMLDDQKENSSHHVVEQKMQNTHQIDFIQIEKKKEDMALSKISSVSVNQVSEADIQKKLKQLMPEFIQKVKQDLIKQSVDNSFIKEQIKVQKPQKKQKIIHNVICDQCEIKDFEGIRYKCAICPNYDICQKCQTTSSHSHPFLKIKHPKQAPRKINVSYHDNSHNYFQFNGKRISPFQLPIVKDIYEAICKPQDNEQRQGFKVNKICPYFNEWQNKCEKKKETQEVNKRKEEKSQVVKCQDMKAGQDKIDLIKNATYISEILQIDYSRCHKFAISNPSLSQEELLDLYFKDTKQLTK